jgi:hypothetical protein
MKKERKKVSKKGRKEERKKVRKKERSLNIDRAERGRCPN